MIKGKVDALAIRINEELKQADLLAHWAEVEDGGRDMNDYYVQIRCAPRGDYDSGPIHSWTAFLRWRREALEVLHNEQL